jgi:hypothetical protein
MDELTPSFLWRWIASMVDEINIDFEPLFKCIHVYDTLGQRQEFKTSYEEDRRVRNTRYW